MESDEAIVAVYTTQEEASNAVKEIQKAGFDMKKLSIIGKDYHPEQKVVGYYNAGERMKYWGERGIFWGGFWGLLFGSAFFSIPGVGPVLVAGSLVSTMVAALEGAVVVGGLSVIGASLASIGIPHDSIIEFETALKANKYLVVANGTPQEIKKVRNIMHAKEALLAR